MNEYEKNFNAEADTIIICKRVGYVSKNLTEKEKFLLIQEIKKNSPEVENFILNTKDGIVNKDSLLEFISTNNIDIAIITEEVRIDVKNSDEMAELYINARAQYNCVVYDEKQLKEVS